MSENSPEKLKRVLKPIHLWAIAVGLVISGEYFGWNNGWTVAGTIGMLIATLVVTLMYITFVFSYTELTSSIPHAGGAFAYAYRAMGPIASLIAGYATLIDFLFAAPAIGFSLGSYFNFLYPAIPVVGSAIVFNILFIVINIIGIKESAAFSVFITLLAVAELLLFMGVIGPGFKMSNYLSHPMPFGWAGVFAALPYAIWFYLAIEGVAMVSEEVKDPKRNIPRGYILGISTLVILAIGVMVLTGGITDWRKLSNLDYPLPAAISIVLGNTNSLTKVFTGIGLFGLIASFHGIILAASRQVFAMSRSGYLPQFLSGVNHRFKTPHMALVFGGLVSIATLLLGIPFKHITDKVIIISVMGAVLMYIVSLLSLFILRKKEPHLERPFVSPFYPYFPAIALLLCCISMFAIIYFNFILSLYFFSGLVVALILFLLTGKHKEKIIDDMLLVQAEAFIDIK